MRTLPQLLIASCLLTSADLRAQESAADLKQRCEEQERQIRRLELENSRLKELINDRAEAAEPAPAPTPAAPSPAPTTEREAAPATAPSGPATHTVKAGETLSRIARRYGTTAAALVQLNGLRDAGLIRPGPWPPR